jgi:hypothetical protein
MVLQAVRMQEFTLDNRVFAICDYNLQNNEKGEGRRKIQQDATVYQNFSIPDLY